MSAGEESTGGYSDGENRPVEAFAGLIGIYGSLVALGMLATRRWGRVPERPHVGDLSLIAVATFKLSRLLSKDPVTSPLRAPFTTFDGTSGDAELKEQVRGTGFRKAVGELVTCPFCVSQWVATAFTFGMLLAPRTTRMVTGLFASVAVSDFLQFARTQAEKEATS